jgi:hypothetical protein
MTPTTTMTPTRNLVISPVGDQSKHRAWLAGAVPPDFDLFLIYFGDGPDRYAADAHHYARRKGFKWELMHYALTEHAEIVARYDRIWCPDDDIICTAEDVNRLFALFAEYRLRLAQPAIAKGEFSYKTLVRRAGNVLRYTPYVEIMCPLFTREALVKVSDTFTLNRSGWGIDWIWPRCFAPGEMAIIDQVGIHHSGTLGKGESYQKLAKLGIDPERDFQEALARYGGIDRGLHRAFCRGEIELEAIPDPADRRSRLARWRDAWRWHRTRRRAA